MRKHVKLDITRRRKFLRFELQCNVIKTLLKNKHLPLYARRCLRQFLTEYLSAVAKLSAIIQNRCNFGSNSSVFSIWGLSRFELKKYARLGLIPGLIKRGW